MGKKVFDPVKCKSNQFCELLMSRKTMVYSRGFTKLKEDFDLDDITISKAFLSLKTASSESFIRSFQFKFWMTFIYTNVRFGQNRLCPKGQLYILRIKLIQKRSINYFMNVRSQFFSSKNLKTLVYTLK